MKLDKIVTTFKKKSPVGDLGSSDQEFWGKSQSWEAGIGQSLQSGLISWLILQLRDFGATSFGVFNFAKLTFQNKNIRVAPWWLLAPLAISLFSFSCKIDVTLKKRGSRNL